MHIKDLEGRTSNEYSWLLCITVETSRIVLKSITTTEDPVATYSNDPSHFIPTGTPYTEVIPTQQEERAAEDVNASHTLTYLYNLSMLRSEAKLSNSVIHQSH